MNSMKFYEQDKYFMEKMKYLNKGRNKNKNNNFQTCRTVRDSLTVKNREFEKSYNGQKLEILNSVKPLIFLKLQLPTL